MVKRLISYLGAHRFVMGTVVATMLASTGVEMLSPWPLKLVVDNVLGQQPFAEPHGVFTFKPSAD